MKIGAVSLGWGNMPLPQIFRELREMGGQCLEINGRPGRHAGLILNEETIPQVQAWADQNDIQISGMSGYCDFAQTDPAEIKNQVALLLNSCRVASQLGWPVVRAFVGEAKPGHALEDFWPQLITAFKQAAEAAGELGVTLAIENHGHLANDGPTLVQLLESIGASNIGLTLDTGNFCWAGRSLGQAARDFEVALPYVVNVHIKDGRWQNGQFEFVPAGEGELDLKGLLGRLLAAGYQGAVCSEYEGAGDFREGTQRSLSFLKAARQEVGS